jgi:hypothetical protein
LALGMSGNGELSLELQKLLQTCLAWILEHRRAVGAILLGMALLRACSPHGPSTNPNSQLGSISSQRLDGFGDIKFGMTLNQLQRIEGIKCADMDTLWSAVLPRDRSIDLGFFHELFFSKQLGDATVVCSRTITLLGVPSDMSIYMESSGIIFSKLRVSSIEIQMPKYSSTDTREEGDRKREVVKTIRATIQSTHGQLTGSIPEDSFRYFMDQFDPGYVSRHNFWVRGQAHFYSNYQIAVTEDLDAGWDVHHVTLAYRSPEYARKFKQRVEQIRDLERQEESSKKTKDMSKDL